MGSLLEKITLYDILGYVVPGFSFLMLVILPIEPQIIEKHIENIDKMGSLLVLAVIITAYVSGMALSEIARWFNNLFWWFGVWSGTYYIPEEPARENIIMALKKSGLVKGQETFSDAKGWKTYYQWMYGDIQIDGPYRRIHNYASAATMYKNIVFACFASIFVRHSLWKNPKILYDLICVGTGIVFLVRKWRFDKKTRHYTEVFFTDKYLSEK